MLGAKRRHSLVRALDLIKDACRASCTATEPATPGWGAAWNAKNRGHLSLATAFAESVIHESALFVGGRYVVPPACSETTSCCATRRDANRTAAAKS